ncbi:MAG: M36 family metallopeptidase [Chloroflexota bacterium]
MSNRQLYSSPFRLAVFSTLLVSLLLAQSTRAIDQQPELIPETAVSFLTGPNVGSPLTIAKNYLNQNYASFGLTRQDLAEMAITDQYTTKHNGTTHIYFQQQFNGIRVYNGFININIAANGSVINAGSQFVGNLADSINRQAPLLSPEIALREAAHALDLTITKPIQRLRTLDQAANTIVLADAGIAERPILAQLVYQPLEDEVRLAWELEISETDTENWWLIRMDAATGKELDRFNYVIHEDFEAQMIESHGAVPQVDWHALWQETKAEAAVDSAQVGLVPSNTDQYNVYAMPDESPNHGSTGRTVVTGAATSASPFGWHDTNGSAGAEFTITRGNNVHAYEDGNNSGFSPDCGNPINCDFPVDLSQSADTYESAAIANLFYWNNIIHDLWYEYGFDEASGNFQENNYGNGGNAGDSVNAEAQDGSGTCNANFATPTDGGNPRMQMYLCGSRDGDFDNGVIVHEYGHGISIRLTGGPSTSSCLNNNEQGGEGWSDWFGLMMTIENGDQGTDSRGIGTYLFGQGPNGGGIRPQPYSTNMGVNSFTYDDVDNGLSVPHGVGWGWATILWDMNWALVDEYGLDHDFYNGSGGNNLAMQLVIDGLKLQGCSPSFVAARDGILLADQNNNSGANQCLLWDVFARRGLGVGADDNGSGLGGEVEAFDLPSACLDVLKISKTAVSQTTAGNTLEYSLTITNDKSTAITNATVTDTIPADTTYVANSATCGGSESSGTVTFNLGTMNSGAEQTCTFEVTVAGDVGTTTLFSDDMESGSSNWTATHNQGSNDWSLGTATPNSPSHAWFAADVNHVTDQYLTLANTVTLTDGSTLSFWHDYNNENNFDGGVVEISLNGGSWQDLGSHITANGYSGTISTSYSSPIGGRQAFTGDSNGYIQTIIDLSSFSGDDAQIRFRLATDSSVSDHGWYIDDVEITDAFQITNTACVSSNEGDNVCDSAKTEIEAAACLTPDNIDTLTITDMGSNIVEIDWDSVNNATEYEVWWDINNPYFNPMGGDCSSPGGFGCATEESETKMEHTQSGNVNDSYSYVVIAKNACGQTSTALSDRVGSFDFDVVPGQP